MSKKENDDSDDNDDNEPLCYCGLCRTTNYLVVSIKKIIGGPNWLVGIIFLICLVLPFVLLAIALSFMLSTMLKN